MAPFAFRCANMTQEKASALLRDFPVLYAQLLWGFECGDGWEPLIRILSEEITTMPVDVVAVQVKEKFGTLRFYTSGGNDRVYVAIRQAERISARTCEACGAPGKLRGEGWLYTGCDACETRRR